MANGKKVGGGIFRGAGAGSKGKEKEKAEDEPKLSSIPKDILDLREDAEKSPTVEKTSTLTSPLPSIRRPATLFDFNRAWNGLSEPGYRWQLISVCYIS